MLCVRPDGISHGSKAGAVLALVLAGVAAAGCASNRGPTLAEAIGRGYPGFAELHPKLSVGRDASAFPYTPGTLIFAVGSDAGETEYVAETDFRCGHATPINRLRAARLKPVHIRSGVAVAAKARARDWLASGTGLSAASLAGVSSVRIALTNVRRVAPGSKDLQRLIDQALVGCPLAGLPGYKSVKSVAIGDVKVEIHFERGFDLGARLALLEQLSLSFGVGYARISDSAILGRQVAFAVQWQDSM